MLPVKLRDIALLRCTFSERFEEASLDEGDQESTEGSKAESTTVPSDIYPDEQLLQLSVTTEVDEENFICFIEGKLEDERLPFELSFELAFLFGLPPDSPVPEIAKIQPTLVWIAFPHLREFVADLTGRSATSQYFLPPLTRLPQPDTEFDGKGAPSEGQGPAE